MTCKQELRKKLMQMRREYSFDKRGEFSRQIAENLLKSEIYSAAETLLCFVSTPIETDTKYIITRAFEDGKKVAVPRCRRGSFEMDFYYITSYNCLECGAYGISEPKEDCIKCENYAGALCVTPGLAYDKRGNRMGFGRGYYDRFLKDFPGSSCGIIYDDFLLEEIPTEKTDIPVRYIITQSKIIQTC